MLQSNISNIALLTYIFFLKTELMQSTENVKTWKFDLWKFWFVIKYLITNVFLPHCMRFYLICFHNQRFHSIYLILRRICDNNISNEKDEILRNCLYINCSWKTAICFNERAPLFGKRAIGLSRRVGEGRIPP